MCGGRNPHYPTTRIVYDTDVSDWRNRIGGYLASLPERVTRSASALAGGLLNEIGGAVLPASVRRTRIYRTMVEAVLRFMIEDLGQVENVFPAEGKLARDFVLRRTAGNGIELLGILLFRASPVWVFAILADVSGASRNLIGEIADCLKQEGLLAPDEHPTTVDQMLDGLERVAGRTAETFNTPPLDVAALRAELNEIRREFASIPVPKRPAAEEVLSGWTELRRTAAGQNRTLFEVSSMMALAAFNQLPGHFTWLRRSAGAAVRRTGAILDKELLEHYRQMSAEIGRRGLMTWWSGVFRPYLAAAARQFAPGRESLTERWLSKRSKSRESPQS